MCSIGGTAECLARLGLDPWGDDSVSAEEPNDDVWAVRPEAPRDRLRTLPVIEEVLTGAEGERRAEDNTNSPMSEVATELPDPSLPCFEGVPSSLMLVILDVGCWYGKIMSSSTNSMTPPVFNTRVIS